MHSSNLRPFYKKLLQNAKSVQRRHTVSRWLPLLYATAALVWNPRGSKDGRNRQIPCLRLVTPCRGYTAASAPAEHVSKCPIDAEAELVLLEPHLTWWNAWPGLGNDGSRLHDRGGCVLALLSRQQSEPSRQATPLQSQQSCTHTTTES